MYRDFVFKVLAGLALFMVLYGLAVYFLYSRPYGTRWVDQCYRIKDDYARSIQTNKIVFAAGSNVLMGISTERIEKALKVPTVNYGVHAGLGTEYTIYKTKQILKEGDTVIMPIEYENIVWEGQVSDILAGHVLTNDREYLHQLPFLKQLQIIYRITPGKFYKVILAKIPAVKKMLLKKGYQAETLNKHGDETSNINKNGPYTHSFSSFKKQKKDLLSNKGLQSIIAFSKWCKENGIDFYFQYPNMLQIRESDLDNYNAFQKRLESILLSNGIKILGTPQDSFFEKEYLFDTPDHLNQDGMAIRTNKVIDSLRTLRARR